MDKRCIFSKNGPPAQGPYSHAVAVGNLLFVSGQGPVAPDGSGLKKGSLEEEVRLALTNLKAILEDAGSGLEHVVKVNAYLSDMDNFDAFNEIYKEYFPMDPPARTCIQAGRLPFDIKVEIEATAVIPD
ncbi:MAG: RidA family protein [Candidatus Hydrogenedentes bacterium]|jgi:2-iminobutanoate/2-iminopropanoate deaminase|nr:RidA family protein [Candidatus Hydrogenedentota bacterium]